ncbi:hypothetical protein Sjap_023610 [Stephania japonica]|uniref:Response regulatory domain-containing protein n=1 Tax=Stephania japonica TaxID=461633 RepID=A0AAP0HJ49_9MAGN
MGSSAEMKGKNVTAMRRKHTSRKISLAPVVVDDKKMHRMIHKKSLATLGVESQEAENGKEAVDICLSAKPSTSSSWTMTCLSWTDERGKNSWQFGLNDRKRSLLLALSSYRLSRKSMQSSQVDDLHVIFHEDEVEAIALKTDINNFLSIFSFLAFNTKSGQQFLVDHAVHLAVVHYRSDELFRERKVNQELTWSSAEMKGKNVIVDETETYFTKKPTPLVVDDSKMHRMIHKKLLATLGVESQESENGKEVVRYLSFRRRLQPHPHGI